jgi:hypothetical protein
MLDTLCMWQTHKNMKSLNLTNVTNVTKINHLHIILMLFVKI